MGGGPRADEHLPRVVANVLVFHLLKPPYPVILQPTIIPAALPLAFKVKPRPEQAHHPHPRHRLIRVLLHCPLRQPPTHIRHHQHLPGEVGRGGQGLGLGEVRWQGEEQLVESGGEGSCESVQRGLVESLGDDLQDEGVGVKLESFVCDDLQDLLRRAGLPLDQYSRQLVRPKHHLHPQAPTPTLDTHLIGVDLR